MKIFELINKNIEGTVLHRSKFNTVSELPIITISREKGSGGRPVAYLLAQKLKSPWRVYHKDIVEEIAQETKLDSDLVKQLDERQSSAIKDLLYTIFGKHFLSMNSYYKHLLRVLATIGTKGNAIIIGRGANFLFPGALKIRIISPMEERIHSLMKYEHISVKEAKKYIAQSDKERSQFTHSLFQHDLRDAHFYDLTIRIDKYTTIEDATEMIAALAQKRFKL